MNATWTLSATELAAAVAAKEVSATEVVTAALDRIAAVEPVSNAFEEVFDDALEQAARADAALTRGDPLGPLHGVPIALKANHDVTGRPTTGGIPAFTANPPAGESSPAVDRLREAGAVLIGRTRMPPGGFRWSTESAAYGVTRNPWDPGVTAGASSGGAGVAVAVGAVPVALGNDIGGSIRYPAAVNGVLGLRPTVNRVPAWLLAQPGLGSPGAARAYCVEGPLARTVADLRTTLQVVGRPDVRDPDAVEYDLPYDRSVRPRVALVRPGSGFLALPDDAETTAAVDDAAAALREQGYEVDEVDLPQLAEAADLSLFLQLGELAATGFTEFMDAFAGESGARAYGLNLQVTREQLGEFTLQTAFAAMTRRSLLRRELSERMAQYPILLTVASGEPPFRLDDDVNSVERSRELIGHQWPALGIPLLALPAVGMATRVRPGAAPIGVQLVGREFAEHQLLDVAAALAEARPVPVPVAPCPLGSADAPVRHP